MEAKVLIEEWQREHNQGRPHSALGYRPPVPEAIKPTLMAGNSNLTNGTTDGCRSNYVELRLTGLAINSRLLLEN